MSGTLRPVSPAPKRWLALFILLHSFPTTFFLYGEPFYAQQRFHWNPAQIGLTQALSGFCIICGSYLGGQIAHHRNPRIAITLGLLGSLAGALVGWMGSETGEGSLLLAMAIISGSQALLWPGIEAALMANETHRRIQHLVGLYNLIWSLGTATAFFLATPLLDRLGLRAIFGVPAVFFAVNLIWLFTAAPRISPVVSEDIPAFAPAETDSETDAEARRLTPEQRAAFRWMSWLANPLVYVAVVVIVTYNPAIQQRLGIGFARASVWGSLWFYARMLTFELLRRWSGWHYRWRFLCGVFGLAMLSFAGIVLAPTLAALLVAQIAFGFSVGLMYQSSLFYAMAGSEAQGAHGGFHESFIGLGLMSGPLIVYAAGRFAPGQSNLPILIVLAGMTVGLVALIALGRRTEQRG